MQPISFYLKHYAKAAVRRTVWPLLPAKSRALIRAHWHTPRMPIHVFFEPTTQCNLRCLHCGRTHWKDRDPNRDIDLGVFKRTVKELHDGGVREMTLQGLGEPFLHKDIFEMIEYTRALGIYTRFNTNFTIFDDAMAERLVRGGHSEVMVSIESIEPKLFADIRRRGDLDTVLTNIKRLADAKQRLGSDTPKIYVNAVLLKSTLELAPRLASEMRRVGASRLNFQGLNTAGIPEKVKLLNGTRMIDNSLSSLTYEEIEDVTQKILALGDADFPVTITGDLGGRDSVHRPASGILTCSDLWESPYIDSSGRVTPCCWLPDGDIMTLGDLRKESFRDVWFGPAYEKLRRQHITGHPPDVCKNCQKLTLVIENGTSQAGEDQSAERYNNFFLGVPKV